MLLVIEAVVVGELAGSKASSAAVEESKVMAIPYAC